MMVGECWSSIACWTVHADGLVCVGAMENWGLVTYRETTLLVDPAQSSAAAKQTVALVVGHELAHQWFGNFVTMVGHFLLPLSLLCGNHNTT